MVLPARIEGPDGLLLRRWEADDAEALGQAITGSLQHLRPWMSWTAHEPVPLKWRCNLIEQWERDWRNGGDVVLGVFLADRVVGGCGLHRRIGCGLHRRIGSDGLELGYWIHSSFLRRGLATQVARLLTDAALGLPGINYVEIHHDKANVASAGVPRKLGFQFVEEAPDEPEAPADLGIEWRWRMDNRRWQARS
jgi:RimJ/RimL family protein N-acetyltransferase